MTTDDSTIVEKLDRMNLGCVMTGTSSICDVAWLRLLEDHGDSGQERLVGTCPFTLYLGPGSIKQIDGYH